MYFFLNKSVSKLLLMFVLSTLLFSAAANSAGVPSQGFIAVANRDAGSVSIIDVARDYVIETITLPLAENSNEPMYVVYTPHNDLLLIGDRGNNRVLAYSAHNYDYIGEAAVGAGVFHMWADPIGQQLWVVGDIDNTISVISPKNLSLTNTIAIPADLVNLGGKPHDVVISPQGESAFVTVVGLAADFDVVIKYDTHSFTELARTQVGKDAHVAVSYQDDLLYVPTQNSNTLTVVMRADLSLVKNIPVDGAHGAGMPLYGSKFLTTNIADGGLNGLVIVDRDSLQVTAMYDLPLATPHNIATSFDGSKIYVTHSGADSTAVSVLITRPKSNKVYLKKIVTTGTNPFGIAFIP